MPLVSFVCVGVETIAKERRGGGEGERGWNWYNCNIWSARGSSSAFWRTTYNTNVDNINVYLILIPGKYDLYFLISSITRTKVICWSSRVWPVTRNDGSADLSNIKHIKNSVHKNPPLGYLIIFWFLPITEKCYVQVTSQLALPQRINFKL